MVRSFLIIAFAIPILAVGARSRADDVLREIEAAWGERQEQFQSFEIEWDESLTMFERSIRVRDDLFPPEDITAVRTHRIVGQGEKLLHSRTGPTWDLQLGRFIEIDYVIAFDGVESRNLWESEKHEEHPSGYVSQRAAIGSWGNYHILPVFLAFRPFSIGNNGVSLSDWTLTDRSGSVDDVPCLILERARRARTDHLWMATDGDYRVLRQEFANDQYAYSQLTLEYEYREGVGNVLKSWKHMLLNENNGDPRQSFVSTVQRLTVNEPVDEEQFRITFPPATIIQESGKISIVQEDGNVRPVAPGELAGSASWDDVMQSDPPPELAAGGLRWRWVGGVILAVLVALVVWKRSTLGALLSKDH